MCSRPLDSIGDWSLICCLGAAALAYPLGGVHVHLAVLAVLHFHDLARDVRLEGLCTRMLSAWRE